jgi:ATP-dependent Clp protease ATP-binding subunit ClpB
MATRKKSSTPLRTANIRQLRELLAARILGQDQILDRLVSAILRIECGGVPPGGCARCFLLAGPTGVGKTETAQGIAELVFGPGRLARFDCAEFKTLDQVRDLTGEAGRTEGRFQQAFAKVSRGVWLFDEIEKAHPEFVHLFLAMTEANRVTVASGETLDLSGLYLVVTTNLGSAEILGREHLPFVSLERHVVRSIERHFRPELLRRFGQPYVFRPLDRDTQERIVALHLDRFLAWHASQGRTLMSDPEVVRFLALAGFSRRLGAGPLLAAIHQHVGDAVVADLMSGGTGSGRLAVDGESLVLRHG